MKIILKMLTANLKSRFLRFVIVGVINTTLAYAVYSIALALGFVYAVANFIALVIGILIGFTTHGKFVFNRLDYCRFWRFILCWILIYCTNIAIIHQLIELQLDPYLAGALALPVIVPLSFIVQKYFVFMHGNSTRNSCYCTKNDNVKDLSKR
jgi:putative flippase GtrA